MVIVLAIDLRDFRLCLARWFFKGNKNLQHAFGGEVSRRPHVRFRSQNLATVSSTNFSCFSVRCLC
jgi:hypothetical protein